MSAPRTDHDRLVERLSLDPRLAPLLLKVATLLERHATIEVRHVKGVGNQIHVVRRERIDVT